MAAHGVGGGLLDKKRDPKGEVWRTRMAGCVQPQKSGRCTCVQYWALHGASYTALSPLRIQHVRSAVSPSYSEIGRPFGRRQWLFQYATTAAPTHARAGNDCRFPED